MMNSARELQIRRRANGLLLDFWSHRDSYWAVPPVSWTDFFPFDLERCVEYLGLRLEEPEEIRDDDVGPRNDGIPFEIAGVLDRDAGRVIIAQKFRAEYRRFTLAHELGHAVLHPAVRYHRDRPLTGGERANRVTRAREELEADLFAAELLMPTCVVNELFLAVYGEPIDRRAVDDELVYWVRTGTGEPVSVSTLRTGPLERLALLVARNRAYRGQHFPSLCETFLVSSTAMRIQLTDLGLVH